MISSEPTPTIVTVSAADGAITTVDTSQLEPASPESIKAVAAAAPQWKSLYHQSQDGSQQYMERYGNWC